ncbi:hypothetical protein OIU78_004200 [Salix suchowensis]|nr:hypothetical protein OIU78_004200 [Salix suchowensis]
MQISQKSSKSKSQQQEKDTKLYDGRQFLVGMARMACQRKFYNHSSDLMGHKQNLHEAQNTWPLTKQVEPNCLDASTGDSR